MVKKIIPKLLEPKVKMPVNEKCWCRSGLKWKKCHRYREFQMPILEGEFRALLDKEIDIGYCLHPEASKDKCQKIINSHTVQKNGGLAAIAEEGHIISPKKGLRVIHENDGNVIPQRFGIKKASTFRGFCSLHDNEMFEKVEQKVVVINQETAFILSFRALCYEYLLKESAVRIHNKQKTMDKGQFFEAQKIIQQHLYMQLQGLEIGLGYIKKWKSKYDFIYCSNNYEKFKFYAVEFKGLLPIVASGAFTPEFDCTGERIQYLTEEVELLDILCFNITSFMGNSILVLGWIPTKKNTCQLFVESFINEKNKANVAMYIAIEQLENIYFKPSWWNALPEEYVLEIEKRFSSGIEAVRTGEAYKNLSPNLTDLVVIQDSYSL